MYEKEILAIGFWLGYFLVLFVILIYSAFVLSFREQKFNKYLMETKQTQRFAEWHFKNKVMLKFIKNDKPKI